MLHQVVFARCYHLSHDILVKPFKKSQLLTLSVSHAIGGSLGLVVN